MFNKLIDLINNERYVLHVDQMLCAAALLEAMHVVRWAIVEYEETGEAPHISEYELFNPNVGICRNIESYMKSKHVKLNSQSDPRAFRYSFDFFYPTTTYAVLLAVFNMQPNKSDSLIHPIVTDEYTTGVGYYNSTIDKYQDGVRLAWIDSCIKDLERIIEVGEFKFPRRIALSKMVQKSMELHRNDKY